MKTVVYPTAAHSYFAISNRQQQKEEFLAGDIEQPVFVYSEIYRTEVVQAAVDIVASDREQNGLRLVEASMAVNRPTATAADFLRFREANRLMFGEPEYEYVQAILGRIEDRASRKSELWEYVCSRVDFTAETTDLAPSGETFLWYKNLFAQYSGSLRGDISLARSLQQGLEDTGLAAAGWKVVEVEDASHARVNQAAKRILVGRQYRPRRQSSVRTIVAHEVYGHAVRGPQASVAESEGFAILLEQLLEQKFVYRRTFRYLAAALGWGVDGNKRTFRDVYEIIWRLMVVVGRYGQLDAQSYAFDECVRVFRGGRPDVAGVVYLKDSVYFAANVQIWKIFDQHRLSYGEFVDIIEGKGILL